MAWDDVQGALEHVMDLEGRRVLVIIEEDFGKRSLNQNAFLHGVVFKYISEATGYEMPEVKTLMKWLFLSRPGKNGRLYARETHRLNRREFGEFLEQCVRWAALELGVVIPEPAACAESYAA